VMAEVVEGGGRDVLAFKPNLMVERFRAWG